MYVMNKCKECNGIGETCGLSHNDPVWAKCYVCEGTGKVKVAEKPTLDEAVALIKQYVENDYMSIETLILHMHEFCDRYDARHSNEKN
jgi:hypothetical protein